MNPIEVQHFLPQNPAKKDPVFELWKLGEEYRIRQITTGVDDTPKGRYLFVIPVNDPGRILCGNQVHGHTSLSKWADVFYAGELEFGNGSQQEKLIRWTNGSEHYTPLKS